MTQLQIRIVSFACLLIGLFCHTNASGSTITLRIQDTQLVAGESSLIDVYLDGLDGATLGQFQFKLNIQGMGPGTDFVHFEALTPAELGDITSSVDYVFSGISGGLTVLPDALDPKNVIVNDIIGDENVNSVDVNGSFLLTRLRVSHFGQLAGSSRDFNFQLVADVNLPTIFDQDADIGTDNDYAPGSIFSNFGNLQVVATPEPASLGIVVLAAMAGSARLAGRRRQHL